MSDRSGAEKWRRGKPLAPGGAARVSVVADFTLLFAACAVGLLLRCLDYHGIFPESGAVVLGLDDAQFHARRALYSFVNFPATLDFDWFLAYPSGAPAPVPPGFDWATAGIARLFGDDIHTLETVAAWVSPIAGALLVWPAYGIGRLVATRGVGLGAAWLSAILPSGILITRLGNFDHHGTVALIAAIWLWTTLSCVGCSGRSLAVRSALQAGAVVLMLFTWSGSLLYLVLGAGAQLAGILLVDGRPQRLLATAASLLAAALATIPWLAVSAPPLGGPLSSQTLSWLHVLGLLGIATPTLILALWERRRPSTGAPVRIARITLLFAAIGLPFLALPAFREQLLQGLFFLAQQDDWAATNPEQLWLFHSTRDAAQAMGRLGLFAYLVPLLPLYLGWRVFLGQEREKLWVMFFWVTALSLLLLSQVRYGTDFTVPGTVVFAMVLADLREGFSRWIPSRVASVATLSLAAIAIAPTLQLHQRGLTGFVGQLLAGKKAAARRPSNAHEIGVRFGKQVRSATPQVSGFLEPGARPEYGILVPPHIGHRFTYTARRPVPSNNLGPYLDLEKYHLAKNFYLARRTAVALKTLDALGVRYVVTIPREWSIPTFAEQLHRHNDSYTGQRLGSGRLRLAATSGPTRPASGKGNTRASQSRRTPFKLFELVPGAVLVVETEAGRDVSAEIQVHARNQRGVLYHAVGRADADGVARIRVPYASRSKGVISTPGPWRVRVGNQTIAYEVSEADVLEGREVQAPPGSPALDSEASPELPP